MRTVVAALVAGVAGFCAGARHRGGEPVAPESPAPILGLSSVAAPLQGREQSPGLPTAPDSLASPHDSESGVQRGGQAPAALDQLLDVYPLTPGEGELARTSAAIAWGRQSRDATVRSLALTIDLSRLDPSSCLASAMDEITDPGSPQEVLAAASVIAERDPAGARAALRLKTDVAALGDRWSVAAALAICGDPTALDRWASDVLDAVIRDVPEAAHLVALAAANPVPSLERLALEAASARSSAVRLVAVQLLRGIGGGDADRALERLSTDEDESVRTTAKRALAPR